MLRVLSGGMGGLGLLFARLAVCMQAQQLTLLDVNQKGVHAVPADLQDPTCKLEVTVQLCDSSFREEASLGREQQLSGLIHAAGVLRDALFLKQTAASFREVLAGKVGLKPSLPASKTGCRASDCLGRIPPLKL